VEQYSTSCILNNKSLQRESVNQKAALDKQI